MQEISQSPGFRDKETASLKIPPHSIEAEIAVLGGVLLDNSVWEKVIERVREEDFYRKDHRIIYRAIAALDSDAKPFDVVTVAEWLDSHKQLEDAGGLPYLAALAENTAGAGNIAAYADIIRKRSVLRQLIRATNEISETVFNPQGRNSDEILDFAEQIVFEIAEQESDGRKSYGSIKELLVKALDRVDELFHQDNPITGVATGFEDFDDRTAGLQPSDLIIIAGRPSMGKAQPLDAKIRALDGWKTMGELKTGDHLASVDGRPSRVAGIYPQGVKDIYRITFSDGRNTEVCEGHLWRVYYRFWNKPRILSTARIMEMLTRKRYQNRLWIDHCSGDFGHSQPLPVDPWVLGALLGDGNLKGTAVRFSTASTEMLDTLCNCLGESYLLRAAGGWDHLIVQADNHHRPGRQGVWPNPLKEELKALGLWDVGAESKYVPELYKTAGKEARLAILRGLLDTDGWVESWGSVRFVTASECLADDVVELSRSVGAWATKRSRRNSYTYQGEKRRGRPCWVINIHHPQPQLLFTLSAKKARVLSGKQRRKMPVIKSVDLVRKAEARCIAVTHSEHLYITDDYVVTHNTAFAINIAEHAAIKNKLSVAIFSMEMSGVQLAMRMMSSLGRIDQHKVRTGRINDDDWPRLTSAVEILKDSRLFIDDTPALTPAELRTRCRRISREHGLDLIIVDYLQLMEVPGTTENRATEISEISRSLKAMAKELNVPVVALSQLNRSLEQRPNKRPVMSDLRESGAIEQDADVIVFIYRDEVYNEDTPDKGKAEIIISKQRNGPIGMVPLTFLGPYTRFENYIEEKPYMQGYDE
ncbi:MAG: replicative DNA helicase [Gammaproteobacteria bacterium]|nr:replicative DNA helicase [Gammaproteobacteria bacterium]